MMSAVDLSERVGDIRCPTLIVVPGGDSVQSLEEYKLSKSLIPDCQFEVYEGLPHNITDAVPDRCAADLAAFLRSHVERNDQNRRPGGEPHAEQMRRDRSTLAGRQPSGWPPGAAAQTDYPDKPIHVIVPFGAGGGTDNLVRTLQPAFEKAIGQPVVVENHPGGGSVIGTELAVHAPADGYTVLVADSGITVNPSLYDSLPYDTLKDLAPVSLLATGPVILVANPSAEADTFDRPHQARQGESRAS